MMSRLTATENRALTTALAVGVALLILRPTGGQEQPSADRSITAADLRRDVEYLASDEMRGRLVGTTENRRAARYIEYAEIHDRGLGEIEPEHRLRSERIRSVRIQL